MALVLVYLISSAFSAGHWRGGDGRCLNASHLKTKESVLHSRDITENREIIVSILSELVHATKAVSDFLCSSFVENSGSGNDSGGVPSDSHGGPVQRSLSVSSCCT